MTDFPWEIVKSETLRTISRDLGIKRLQRREEIIVFLRAVQKKGLGPALVEEISRELQKPTILDPSEAPSSTPATPSRRSTSQKRRAPDPETDNNDTEIETSNEDPVAVEPVSPSHNTRYKSTKRVRVSDPGPLRTRSGRRHIAPAPTPATRSAVVGTRGTKGVLTRSSLKGKNGRTKKSVKIVEVINNSDVDYGEGADAEEGEHESPESEEEMEGEDGDTGPGALAAALTRARKPSAPTGRDGRPSATATASKSATKANARPRRRSSLTRTSGIATRNFPSTPNPQTRSAKGAPSPTSKVSGRTVKPTAKAASLSPTRRPASVLSKPLRTQQRKGATKEGNRKRSRPNTSSGKVQDSVVLLSDKSGGYDRESGDTHGGEVFDGVILKKRRVGNGALQLDEFVANGIGHGQANGTYENAADLVLEREELSSLGGSNKENDFSFRDLGDVSMSTDGVDNPLLVGEEDAEGETEPEARDQIQTQAEPNNLPNLPTVEPRQLEQPQSELTLEHMPETLV